MTLVLRALVSAAAAVCALASTSETAIELVHRVYHPDIPQQPFLPRGTISLQSHSTALFSPAPLAQTDLASLLETALSHSGALYQLAFQWPSPSGPDPVHLDISAVNACHVPLASADLITLHLAADGTPYHVDYYLDNVGHDAACPSRRSLAAIPKEHIPPFLASANTSIRVRYPSHPPLPQLRTPPPLSPQGQPIVPPPEKTFLQKYWMYILLALFGLLLSGGPPEEEGAGGAAPGAASGGGR